jgi:hypothetical protein
MSSSCEAVMLATTMAARAAGDAVELTQGHDGAAECDGELVDGATGLACGARRTCRGACRAWRLAAEAGMATPMASAAPTMTTSARRPGIRTLEPPTM